MNRLLIAMFLAAALAGCKIGGSETTTAAAAACTAVGSACAQNSDCCSYGCQSGICMANPVEGGFCRTTNDCASPRLCKSGRCTTPTLGMCRDDADVCSTRYACCSGNCVGGACTVNRAPVANAGPDVPDAPYTKLFTLTNASSDPDLDPLTFGWSFVSIPAGSTATLSSTTGATPSFMPDKTGTYVVRLVVTDGPAGAPNRLTAEDAATITVVNRQPVVTATAPATTWSRNVPVTISGNVSDPDGDTLQCAWRISPPGTDQAPISSLTFAPCINPSMPSFTFSPSVEGIYVVDLVVQDHDRTTNVVVNTVLATATFTAINDPPTPQVSRTPYYANLGASGSTPPIVLDASSSSDTNGDAPLAFFWEVISASDGGTLPTLTDADTATPSFIADRAVDYVLRLTVTDPAQFDRAGASSTLDVTVRVGRYVKQFSHDVLDAARATTADKLILGGHDPSDSAKGSIWVYDLATGTEGSSIALVDPTNPSVSGIPRLVGATPDGSKAVVVDSSVGVSIWIVNLGITPTVTRIAAPWAIGDLVVAGNRYAYLFKANPGTGSGEFRELDLTNGTLGTPSWSGYGGFGAAYSVGTTTWLYRVDVSGYGYWYRYAVNNSGVSATAAAWGSAPQCGGYPSSVATAIWPTLNAVANGYVISSCGNVYSGSSLGTMNQNIGFSPLDADSAADGSFLAVDPSGTALKLLNATLALQGTDTLPRWALDGYGRTAYARHAFIDSAGSRRVAVVSDTATPPRYGIITFP